MQMLCSYAASLNIHVRACVRASASARARACVSQKYIHVIMLWKKRSLMFNWNAWYRLHCPLMFQSGSDLDQSYFISGELQLLGILQLCQLND